MSATEIPPDQVAEVETVVRALDSKQREVALYALKVLASGCFQRADIRDPELFVRLICALGNFLSDATLDAESIGHAAQVILTFFHEDCGKIKLSRNYLDSQMLEGLHRAYDSLDLDAHRDILQKVFRAAERIGGPIEGKRLRDKGTKRLRREVLQ